MIMDFKEKLVDYWKRKRFGMGWLVVLALFVVMPALIGLFLLHPELAKFVAYLLGGGLLLWQVRASSDRVIAAEKTAKAMQQTANSTEKGNIAERFKNAIEHLGNESTSVRLGGIYALHHIAKEEKDYRKRVFEILCAHIRETTTQSRYKPSQYSVEKRKHEEEGGLVPPDGGKWLTIDKVEPSMEIQSILKLLFVEHVESITYNQLTANLAGANLQGAILIKIKKDETASFNWENADLTNTNLQGVTLDGANLQFASMHGAKLHKTMLQGANLKNAYLDHSNARETDFCGADLQECNFRNANLQGAIFMSAKNLQSNQLLDAKTLYDALFPAGMEADIERRNYKLLEKPKLDNEPDA